MDLNIIYAKTPIGDEAVRQRTRVVQRNLRMVLVQIDGKTSIGELSARIGNQRLVESAVRELADGGFIAPAAEAASVWENRQVNESAKSRSGENSALSHFSTFGPKSIMPTIGDSSVAAGISQFSTFGKPILPTKGGEVSPPDEPVAVPAGPTRRRPARTGWLLPAVTLGVLAFVAVLAFYPYDRFRPALEESLAESFGAPVRIDSVALRILPLPRLVLSGVRSADDLSVDEIAVGQPWRLLGNRPYALDTVNAAGVTVTADRLTKIPAFAGTAASDISVRRLLLDRVQFQFGPNVALADVLSARVDFSADGVLDKADFENGDRTLLVEARPGTDGMLLTVEGRGWKPDGVPAALSSLQAKGNLQPGRLLLSDIDMAFLGGLVRGSWLFDWRNGLSMAGDASLVRLDAGKTVAAFAPSFRVEGEMTGALRLRSRAANWSALWSGAEAGLDVQLQRGLAYGLDLGEVARRGGGAEVQGGTTRFDHLRAMLDVNTQRVLVRNIALDAGMMTATGQLAIDRRSAAVDGNLNVNLRTSVSNLNVPVRVSGTPPGLVVSNRK